MPLEYSLVLHADTPAAVTLEGRPADPHDCLLLQQVGGLDGAPVDQDVNPWPGGDGDILGQLSVRGRTLSVEGLIVAPSRGRLRELERDLRRACAPTVDTWPVVVDGRVGDPALSLDVRTGEPLVTVELLGKEPIKYEKMDEMKMRQVFKRHVLEGEIQTPFVLAKGAEVVR